MYLTAGKRVVALEPETGKEIWSYELTGQGNPSNRGVSYWPGDKTNPPRIIFTAARRMIALNANTGKVDPGFGKEGEVDLVVPYNSPPTIYGNFVFVGANVPEQPATGQPGNTRAYDARDGKKLWEFHSVPQPGEPGHESWQGDDWKDRTGVNNWGFYMTVDAQRGLLYSTFGSPASDFYGFDRAGNDLFGNSVVAIDINTGKDEVVFPGRASRPVGHGSASIAAAAGCDGERKEDADSGADRQAGIHVPAESRDRQAGLRREGNAGGAEHGSGRTHLAHAADSGEASGAGAAQLHDGGSGDRGRHQRSARQSVPGAGRKERAAGESRAVHAVGVIARRERRLLRA